MIVTDEVDHNSIYQFRAQSFVAEKFSNIEQVARVLAIERSQYLSCIQVSE